MNSNIESNPSQRQQQQPASIPAISGARTASQANLPDARQTASKQARLRHQPLSWPDIVKQLPYTPKQYQIKAIEATAAGKDCLIIAPTGSGKGYILNMLLKALPLLRFIVLEPLVLLQEELKDRIGDEAIYVHSGNRSPELLKDIQRGKYRMVFLSPEMAIGNAFREVLMDKAFEASLGAVIFDEAQVLKDWAVDSQFRKGFKEISVLRHMAQVPGMAMSGTLPPSYREEVRKHFELQGEVLIDIGTDRPNIELVVQPIRHSMSSYLDVLACIPELHEDPPTTDEEHAALKAKCKPTIVYIDNKTQQLDLLS
ncbi:hypothetical protein CF326_g3567 [Tilletia indica]|nr:hypothetical protein CF326_g3567 [Tilletia indica]